VNDTTEDAEVHRMTVKIAIDVVAEVLLMIVGIAVHAVKVENLWCLRNEHVVTSKKSIK
jgi:hypothetical protein